MRVSLSERVKAFLACKATCDDLALQRKFSELSIENAFAEGYRQGYDDAKAITDTVVKAASEALGKKGAEG